MFRRLCTLPLIIMKLPGELLQRLELLENPVILLEGTRALPPDMEPVLTAFASKLARLIPNAVFRSGNAPGSDDAFSRGVEAVAPGRLEQFIPATRHRSAKLHPAAKVLALDALSPLAAEDIAAETAEASPKYASLLKNRQVPKLKTKADYLLRDTLKVTGDGKTFAPADAGIFFVNPENPYGGGTGHTIAVCRKRGTVLVYTQKEWLSWME